jgi:transcription termination factor NusB
MFKLERLFQTKSNKKIQRYKIIASHCEKLGPQSAQKKPFASTLESIHSCVTDLEQGIHKKYTLDFSSISYTAAHLLLFVSTK